MRRSRIGAGILALVALCVLALWLAPGGEVEIGGTDWARGLGAAQGSDAVVLPGAPSAAPAARPAAEPPHADAPADPAGAPVPAPSVEAAPDVDPDAPARPARPVDAGMGAVRVRVAWDDGSPAAETALHVMAWGGPDAFAHAVHVRTGADGVALASPVRPGKATVYAHLGGSESCEVHAGAETEVALVLERGRRIAGRVIDPAGHAVPGAEIWLSDSANWGRGEVVARADGEGAFVLPSVGGGHYISARAPGFGPARNQQLGYTPGDVAALTLQLTSGGGVLDGRVYDVDGVPLAGADIHVDDGPDDWEIPPIRLVSDATGAFRVEGLAAGPTRLCVRAPGRAPWDRRVDAPLVGLIVRLVRGGSIAGVVRDEGGRAIPGASLGIGEYGDVASAGAKSGPDGAYRLDAIAPGRVAVRASAEGVGKIDASLDVREAETTFWDPVLAGGRRLEGRIVDEAGAPLAGWRVDLEGAERDAQGRTWRGQGETDAEGRFAIPGCPEGPLQLELYEPGWGLHPDLVQGDVRAPGTPLLFRIGPEQRATAGLAVRVLGVDGAPLAGAETFCWHEPTGSSQILATDADGRLRLEGLPPARYRLEVKPAGAPRIHLGTHALVAGRILDLGDVRIEAPGTALLVLRPPEGAEFHGATVYVVNEEGSSVLDPDLRTTPAADGVLVGPLAAGPVTLRVLAPPFAPADVVLTIRPGETTRVEVPLVPAPAEGR